VSGSPGPGRVEQTAAPARTDPKWWTLAAVCLGTFMLLLDITVVNVALPDIQTELSASFSDLQWVIDAYALTLASLLLTAGSLADMYGRRRLYLVGLVLFSGASALCGAAWSPLVLELARALQGVGGATMFAVSLALLADAFRGRDRGVAFGVWGAVTGVAVSVGPIVGGLLVTGLSWRWIFYVNLPVGVVAVALTLLKVAESRDPQPRRPDWPGVVVFSAALGLVVYGLIEAGRLGFTAPRVLVCLVLGLVLLVVFGLVEIRVPYPMFDLRLFRVPTFVGGDIAAFGLSAGVFSMLLFLVLYLQDVLGYSALQTGLRLLVLSGGILVVSGVAGRLTSRVPIRALIGPGLALAGTGLLMMRGLTATTDWTHLIPGLAVAGVGIGLVNPPLASTAVGVVEPHRAGMASGINSTFRQVGIATGIAALGALFTSRLAAEVTALTAGTPLATHSDQISGALRNGGARALFATAPPQQQAVLEQVVRGSFTSALDHVLLVAGVLTLVCAVLAFALIRSEDLLWRRQS